MSYEVQFQHEGAEYTARGPDIDGVLRLIQGVQGVGRVPDWIEWSGGACPVPADTWVEIKLRSGETATGTAALSYWEHRGQPGDIVRYHVCA